ncbi:MAG: TonB-dependent receptor [Acidobacteria bacterium]|nr:TonB-dependent receptor [Acidobacteriota bacterium]
MESRLRAVPKTLRVFTLWTLALSLLALPAFAQDGAVSGTVTDADGDPLPGVLVSVEGGGEAMSDADGAFSISGVEAGSHTVTASLEGFQSSSQSVQVTASRGATVSFEIRPSYHATVVVTAERVEENVMEVPMTITAFDSSILEELVIQERTDLQNLVPGLQFGDEIEQQGQGTVIRGIGTRNAQYDQADYAVATYVDGAYTLGVYGTTPGGGFDLERVEVARGPQGTLNGRNSIAGAINVVTKGPTDHWDAELMGEVTDISQQRLNGALGGPLGDGPFSFRLTAGNHTGDGRQENVGPGGDHDAPDQLFYAPQLRAETERFSVRARWAHVEDSGTPRGFVQLSNVDRTTGGYSRNRYYLWETPNPALDANCGLDTPAWNCPGEIRNRVAFNYPGINESESDFGVLRADWQVSRSLGISFNASSGETVQQALRDADYTSRVPIGTPPGGHGLGGDPNTLDHTLTACTPGLWDGLCPDGTAPFSNSFYDLPFEYEEDSQELLFRSSYAGDFNFIGGLFMYDNKRSGTIHRHDLQIAYRFGTPDDLARRSSPVYGFYEVGNCEDGIRSILGVEPFDVDAEGLFYFCPEGNEHSHLLSFFNRAKNGTRAAFFSGDYRFNDKWALSGGVRYTEDEKEQKAEDQGGFFTFSLGGIPVTIALAGEGNPYPQTWSRPIGHLALERTTDAGHLVYGRVSTGFRSGGFNIGLPGQVPPYIKEETLVNYELGAKGFFLDSRLQLSAGLWYNQFDNYQLSATQAPPPGVAIPVSIYSSSPLAEYTANIPDTTIQGVDLEFSYRIGSFGLRGFYAWQDSEIGPHSSVVDGHPDAQTATWNYINFDTGQPATSEYDLPTDQTGNRLPKQPRNKLALTATWFKSLASAGHLSLQSTYAFTDPAYPSIGNVDIWKLPSFDRLDVGGTWSSPSDRWSVSLFVKNIMDEVAVLEYLPFSGNGGVPALGFVTPPREVGMQLRIRPFN